MVATGVVGERRSRAASAPAWWTGVDSYEWHHGYDVRFGLFDRDRNPKPAADIARRAALG